MFNKKAKEDEILELLKENNGLLRDLVKISLQIRGNTSIKAVAWERRREELELEEDGKRLRKIRNIIER